MQEILIEAKKEIEDDKKAVVKEYLKQLVVEKEKAEIHAQELAEKLNKLLDLSLDEVFKTARFNIDLGKVTFRR